MKTEIQSSGNIARWFKFQENGTTMRKEIIAGLTTFATMAYIIAVVPDHRRGTRYVI